MEVRIPFQPEFEAPMLDGDKICTTRTKRYGYPGATFKAFGAEFRLVNVYSAKLSECLRLYDCEAFKSPEAFVACWERLHPRKRWQPEQIVWVHFFLRCMPIFGQKEVASE